MRRNEIWPKVVSMAVVVSAACGLVSVLVWTTMNHLGAWDARNSDNLLTFRTPSIDLGRIPVHEPQKVTYGFANRNRVPVTIRRIEKSCACLGALSYPKESILPGSEGTFELSYSPKQGHQKYALLVKLASGQSQLLTVSAYGYYDLNLSRLRRGLCFASSTPLL